MTWNVFRWKHGYTYSLCSYERWNMSKCYPNDIPGMMFRDENPCLTFFFGFFKSCKNFDPFDGELEIDSNSSVCYTKNHNAYHVSFPSVQLNERFFSDHHNRGQTSQGLVEPLFLEHDGCAPRTRGAVDGGRQWWRSGGPWAANCQVVVPELSAPESQTLAAVPTPGLTLLPTMFMSRQHRIDVP